ncbi:GtrA family protein [Terrabacter terrigena]|uniref:GtrA family protein n=1 Tax=Terrabacter terrigena TaxID=574718 RepID=A0ABW3MRM3_9MICO
MTTNPPPPEQPGVLRQVVRFSLVGAFGFVADVGGFNLLRYAGGEGPLHAYPLTAKVVSGVLATVVAWLGNRYWTFRNSRRDKAYHEFLLFAVVAGIGTLIAMSCLWVSHYLLRFTSPLADNISANVIGLGLALTFRFWAYRRHVFSRTPPPVSTDEAAPDVSRETRP